MYIYSLEKKFALNQSNSGTTRAKRTWSYVIYCLFSQNPLQNARISRPKMTDTAHVFMCIHSVCSDG